MILTCLYEEVNRTEPYPIVRLSWFRIRIYNESSFTFAKFGQKCTRLRLHLASATLGDTRHLCHIHQRGPRLVGKWGTHGGFC